MGYIGQTTPTVYHTPTAVQRYNGNDSATTFSLTTAVPNVQSIVVSVDGVVQDTSSYTIPDGTTLTFDTAPSTGTGNIFVYTLMPTAGSIVPPAENKGNFKGGGLFRTNAQTLTSDITILATENANVTGPFTVASGVTLTVESGGTLVTL